MKLAILFVAILTMLSGCNTIEGIAEDVAGGARAVSRAF